MGSWKDRYDKRSGEDMTPRQRRRFLRKTRANSSLYVEGQGTPKREEQRRKRVESNRQVQGRSS